MEFDAAAVLSASRCAEQKQVRHAVFYVLSERLGISYIAIGRAFGRSHSTVINAVKQTGNLIYLKNQYIIKLIEKFTNYLKELYYV
jgi:chromosomal replication initiation ATPase DnaA